MGYLRRLGQYLRTHQRAVLLALLAVLHVTLLAGPASLFGLMFWFVDVGLFLLWQPFVRGERHLGLVELLFITLALVLGSLGYGVWLQIFWVVVLAALLGGRVLMVAHRPTRAFYLLAFAYLLGALLIALVPRVVPDPVRSGSSLDAVFFWLAPVVFPAMLLIPASPTRRMPSRGIVDLFYSLFIFLLIAVLVLGSLAFMLLSGAQYVEAVFKTLISLAGTLLVIAYAWDSRPGFAGIGLFVSRYLLSIGLPFENWLQRLMECAARESDPERFLAEAFEGLGELPWVVGGDWSPADGARGGSGRFGVSSDFAQAFSGVPLVFTLFTEYKLSPVLAWHFHLLLQLTNEFYAAKQRMRELQRISYLKAVHETGARLTHDVKNLLQSLDALCYAAQQSGVGEDDRLQQLLSRQLPQITLRLRGTLDKLRQPEVRLPSSAAARAGDVLADVWWDALRQRYAAQGVIFDDVCFERDTHVPSELFNSVVDNLLQNALVKRQTDGDVEIHVSLGVDGRRLQVRDTGRAIPAMVAAELFAMPVSSDSGLGIGLYHAARQAKAFGFLLDYVVNADGNVCFDLQRADASGDSTRQCGDDQAAILRPMTR